MRRKNHESCAVLHAGNEPEDRAVENLLQRAADGVLAEDRREALEHLRDLMQESAKVRSSATRLDTT